MWIGFCLVLGLIAMAVLFALGTVVEQSSFGLTQVITIISTIALGWAQWAFPHALRYFRGGQEETSQETSAGPSPPSGTTPEAKPSATP